MFQPNISLGLLGNVQLREIHALEMLQSRVGDLPVFKEQFRGGLNCAQVVFQPKVGLTLFGNVQSFEIQALKMNEPSVGDLFGQGDILQAG